MATVAMLTVSNATQVDPANWVTPQEDVYGPQLFPTSAPRGACVIQAITSPANSPTEWNQIVWTRGEPVPGRLNQRLVPRLLTGKTLVEARIGGSGPRVIVWVMWAAVTIRTSGPRPPRAKSWSAGMPFTGGEVCGAFVVNSFSMGENARGQVVAVAELADRGRSGDLGRRQERAVQVPAEGDVPRLRGREEVRQQKELRRMGGRRLAADAADPRPGAGRQVVRHGRPRPASRGGVVGDVQQLPTVGRVGGRPILELWGLVLPCPVEEPEGHLERSRPGLDPAPAGTPLQVSAGPRVGSGVWSGQSFRARSGAPA